MPNFIKLHSQIAGFLNFLRKRSKCETFSKYVSYGSIVSWSGSIQHTRERPRERCQREVLILTYEGFAMGFLRSPPAVLLVQS